MNYFKHTREALEFLTSAEHAAYFVKYRTAASTMLATTLRANARLDQAGIPALYAVTLIQHQTPIYVGQTLDARRRLWDLPIGESHHLSNTFPIEIWRRVTVVRWRDFMAAVEPRYSQVLAERMESIETLRGKDPQRAMGLALEFGLQAETQPLFNLFKRVDDGTTRPVRLEESHSTGALLYPHILDLYQAIRKHWSDVAGREASSDFGCTVNVQEILGSARGTII